MTDLLNQAQRRQFLIASTASVGVAGLAVSAYPFLASMAPSEAAKAAGAPVELDVAGLAPGNLFTVEWRGRPVWVLHRTPAMLANLAGHDDTLADPQSLQPQQPPYAANATRSRRPELFVALGVCTHLGCTPAFQPQPEGDWPGGFFCPCHGSRFDLAGRVFRNVPAPRNLEVPPHRYLTPLRLLIGDDSGS